ncbi:MAG TPA: hypothetical protein VNZ52_05515 [Candidatus Thermoplasmatota archaeon]|nr:hypothetical protein [Candidatus Thermoplasmatota archaeon]
MMIEATTQMKLNEAKEIKVKIPLDFHVKLHTLKVLKGQSISDTVELALQKYFSDFAGDAERAMYHEVTTRAVNAFHS